MVNLLNVESFKKGEILEILNLSKKIEKNPLDYIEVAKGKSLANLFLQESTRTRISFSLAMQKLGGMVVDINKTKSGKEMGTESESFEDTIKVLGGYVDLICLRSPDVNAPIKATESTKSSIINCGNGYDQHPTQALLGIYAIWKDIGRLNNLNVAIVGDLKYSRCAHALLIALSFFENNRITLISPKEFKMPREYIEKMKNKLDIKETEDFILEREDVVYMAGFSIVEKYEKYYLYDLDLEKAKNLSKKAIILCPLPRITEIKKEVDNLPQARYFEQTRNGLFVRMAILIKILEEREKEKIIERAREVLPQVMIQLRSKKRTNHDSSIKNYFLIPSDIGNPEQALFWISTKGCSYSRQKAGGCTMCNFSGNNHELTDSELLREFINLLENPIIRSHPVLNYGGQGSFFDDIEHSPNLRKKILEEIAKRDWVKVFVCESRPEYIAREKIEEVRNILKNKIIEIGVGLESTNSLVREGIINKNFNKEAYERLLGYAREFNIELSIDVMFKPNILTEKEAIEDCVKTIKETLRGVDENHPIKRIILMIINIKPNTLIEWAFNKGDYQTPLLWSCLEILKRLSKKERRFVKILGFDTGINPIKYAGNEDNTTEEIIKALKQHSVDYDINPLLGLEKMYKDSPSYIRWKKRMNTKSRPLQERLIKFYNKLEREFLLTKNK